MGNCSAVTRTGRIINVAVIPIVYLFLMALGCIYTFTLRENSSVKTSWIYIMTFTFVFILIAGIMLVASIVKACTRGEAKTTFGMIVETLYWLGLVASNTFLMGLVWWVHHEGYTDDAWQHQVAHFCWSYSIATMPLPLLMGAYVYANTDENGVYA
jgi:hypothetical protein